MKSAVCAKNGSRNALAAGDTPVSSIASDINSNHLSRSATPIRNDTCLILNLG